MNQMIKDATVKQYDFESHVHLRQHLDEFVSPYNFGQRLKALKGSTQMSTFATSGWPNQDDLGLIRVTKCRD
jgi:hypothetical protein